MSSCEEKVKTETIEDVSVVPNMDTCIKDVPYFSCYNDKGNDIGNYVKIKGYRQAGHMPECEYCGYHHIAIGTDDLNNPFRPICYCSKCKPQPPTLN